MRRLLFAFVLAIPLVAQTTVSDNLTNLIAPQVGGGLVSSLRISWPNFTTASGTVVAAGFASPSVDSSGNFSYSLQPNAGGTPTVSYTFTFGVVAQVGFRPTYYSAAVVIPVSVSAVTLSQCAVTAEWWTATNQGFGSILVSGAATPARTQTNFTSTDGSVVITATNTATENILNFSAAGGPAGGLSPATTTNLGGVIIGGGSGLSVDMQGHLTVNQVAYSSLSGLPTLGSAAAHATTDFDAAGAAAAVAAAKQNTLGFTPENSANKGSPSGYAPLNSSSVVPLTNLPTIPYTQLSGTPSLGTASTHAATDFQTALGFTPENSANKGAASGYAPLDGTSKVPYGNLPQIAYSSLGGLPTLGTASQHAASDFQLALGFTPENVANKAAVDGYAPLDGAAKVPLANLPTIAYSTLSGLPTLGTASQFASSFFQTALTFTGNGTKTASSTGSLTTNDCAKVDSNGNFVDAGAACGVGTVGSGTSGQFALYASNGTIVGGHTLVAGDIPSLSYDASGAAAAAVAAIPVSGVGQSNPALLSVADRTTFAAKQTALGFTPENSANKGSASGYAPLNGSSQVPLANLPIVFTGNGANTASSTGSLVSGNCAKWDANGNVIDAGAPCGTGGSGTVSSGSAGQFAYYSANGSTVVAHSLVAGDIPALPYDVSGAASVAVAAIPVSGASQSNPALISVADRTAFAAKQGTLTFTGNGTKTASSTGTLTTNDCAKWDASGNIIDSGSVCATLPTGTTGQFAYYAANGSVVSAHSLVAGDIPALPYDTSGAAAVAVAAIPVSGVGQSQPALISVADRTAFAAKQAALGFTPENSANKGAVSGYAPLNGSSVVPLTNLPTIPYSQTSGVQATLTFTGNGTKTASSTGSLTTNDCVKWDVNGNAVDFGGPCGGAPPQSFSMASQTSLAMTHNLGSTNVIVACYSSGSPSVQIFPGSVTINSANQVTAAFDTPQSGHCVINGGTGPQGPAGTGGSSGTAGTIQAADGSGGLQASDIVSLLSYGAVCDGAHMTADTAAFVAALASGSTGKAIHIPAGTCQVNNSSGPLTVTAWNGLLYGDGRGSKIVFNTLTNHGFNFTGVSNVQMRDLDISYSPTVTTRNTSNLIQIVNSANISLTNLWLHNGNSVAIDLTSVNNITVDGISMSNFLANGILGANISDARFGKIACTGVQDACWEVSYYDSNATAYPTYAACDRITLNGLTSEADYSGININSCKHVSVSNFAIDSPKLAGLYIRQDSTTTTLVWPDDINISNGTITNTGVNTGSDRAGIMLLQGTTSTNKVHVDISNVIVRNTPDWGLLLRDFNNFDLQLSNSMFDNVGTSTSNGNAGGLQFGNSGTHGGDQVHISNVTVKNAGFWSLNVFDTPFLTANAFSSYNPNQQATATIGILNSSTGVVNLDNINLYDSGGTNRSTINDAAAGGSQNFTNVNSYAAGTWSGITSSNAAIVTSCNVAASGCKALAVASGGTGVTSAQGSGSKVQLSSGATTLNDCVKFDANGNTVDAGAACGAGSGLPTQTVASILLSNGSVASWGNLPTGGSGGLDCATVPGVCDIATAVVPRLAANNAWTGANDFSGASLLKMRVGAGVPSTNCAVVGDVGSVYVRNDAGAPNASLYLCDKSGVSTYGWELIP